MARKTRTPNTSTVVSASHGKKAKAPATTRTNRTAARRVRIASGLLAGKRIKQIAEDEGISRNWASRHANSSPVQQLIGTLVQGELVAMHRVFRKVLGCIEAACGARVVASFKGVKVSLGPDHYARLTAGKTYLAFALAGRAMPKEPENPDDRPITMEEIKRVLKARQAKEEIVQ